MHIFMEIGEGIEFWVKTVKGKTEGHTWMQVL